MLILKKFESLSARCIAKYGSYDIFGRMIQQDRVHYKLMYDPLRYSPD
jgi:hypothetical protein